MERRRPRATSEWAPVTANYLSVVGAAPAVGRFFTIQDARPDAERTVVVSHDLWVEHFGGMLDIVGQRLTFGDGLATVVGVAEAGLAGHTLGYEVDVWQLVGHSPHATKDNALSDADDRWLLLLGRLTDDSKMDRAREQLAALNHREVGPGEASRRPDRALQLAAWGPLPEGARQLATGFIGLLGAMMTLVLFVTCVNVHTIRS